MISGLSIDMGLFNRLRRPQLRWECNQCGEVHSSNPHKCSNCGHTVFTQNRHAKHSRSSGSSETTHQWCCMKCGHVHDRKPFTCDECNSSTLEAVPEQPSPPSRLTVSEDEGRSGNSLIVRLVIIFMVIVFGALLLRLFMMAPVF